MNCTSAIDSAAMHTMATTTLITGMVFVLVNQESLLFDKVVCASEPSKGHGRNGCDVL